VGEIQARLSAATPGPWELFGSLPQWENEEDLSFGPDNAPEVGIVKEGLGDAEFIAAAPADVAYLLAELRKAREALARVEAVADEFEAKAGHRWAAARLRAAVAAANGDGEES
jgi:hypothetical protein